MITVYTLPNCPICNMIKTKLKQKNIQYEEKDFSLIANIINTDRAPVLDIENNPGEHFYITSLPEMVALVNQQE